jgi:hypothetical protein
LLQALDTTTVGELSKASKELVLDSAVVMLRKDGQAADTLHKISSGLYSRKDLQLTPGEAYTLTVHDCRKGFTATATTTYLPVPAIDTVYPEQIRKGSETTSKLHLRIKDISQTAYYFVCYNTVRQAREGSTTLPRNVRALNLFVPKQIALFSTADAVSGRLDKEIILQVQPTDTALIQVGQIDKAYYDYLAAYKRTGALINQLTGEPINLPTNISSGYGYFSLFNPVRELYDLNKF